MRAQFGSGEPHQRHLYAMGLPRSWCDRALEVKGHDVDAAIEWIVSHGEELVAAEETADRSESPPSGSSLTELIAAIGNEDDNDSAQDFHETNSESQDDSDSIPIGVCESEELSVFHALPPVDCSSALSCVCGSASIDSESLSCGGPSSSGFPSVGCRGFAVSSGKWYFEVHLETSGCIQIGWADVSFTGNADAGEGVGG